MSKSYHEIMEKIEVTDEIRTRILNNVSKQVFSIPHKEITFPHLWKMASIAACVALLLIGGTMMKNAFYPTTPSPDQEMLGRFFHNLKPHTANFSAFTFSQLLLNPAYR